MAGRISELLLPPIIKNKVNHFLKKISISIYIEAYSLLIDNIALYNELKNYYKQIFTQDFSLIKKMNKQYLVDNVSKRDALFIDTLAFTLIQKEETMQDSGLFYGKMGIYIFLFHYARQKKDVLLTKTIQTNFNPHCSPTPKKS